MPVPYDEPRGDWRPADIAPHAARLDYLDLDSQLPPPARRTHPAARTLGRLHSEGAAYLGKGSLGLWRLAALADRTMRDGGSRESDGCWQRGHVAYSANAS